MVLGHPLEALAWLANARAARGLGLKRGEFVFLGSLVETKWLSAGDQVRIEIDELGGLELKVGLMPSLSSRNEIRACAFYIFKSDQEF